MRSATGVGFVVPHVDQSIDVVLPCLNEAAALPAVLARIPGGYRAIVVDNGSTDGSAEVAAAQGAVVVHEPRRGYGAAVQAGLAAASREAVAVLDADGSLDPYVLPSMVAVLAAGKVDLVVGRRVPARPRALSRATRLGNAVLAAALRRRGVPVRDIARVRVARRARLLELGASHPGAGYSLQLLLLAGRAGWRLHETDVACGPRVRRGSAVPGSLRGSVRAARDMVSMLR